MKTGVCCSLKEVQNINQYR